MSIGTDGRQGRTLTITRGLPASGKSSWAKAQLAEYPDSIARVNRDDLREMLFHKADYTGRQEVVVTKVQRAIAQILLDAEYDVIADDTNLPPRYAREWWAFALKAGASRFVMNHFETCLDECLRRDAAREKPVGEKVIRRMYERGMRNGKFLPVTPPKETVPPPVPVPYVPDPEKPKAIIVDVDGTVALMGDRNPYDMTRVSQDEPNAAVVEVVRRMAMAGYRIIFCSGRTADGRIDTVHWLGRRFGGDWELFMRAVGDSRKDSVVKLEIFNEHIRDNYNVVAVFDDRDQVVEMWRDLGLTCMQVAPGAF